MRKKILIADSSEAVRNIAESILHQNGYEVLTAATIEKAKQLIISSEPSLVIIGADMKDAKEIYLYEILAENEVTAKIPMLLIADPDGRQIPFPPEVVLPRPFEPSEFIEKVKLFSGADQEDVSPDPEDPFNTAAVDDEFLDAALGLDSLQVEDSEEMDKTTTTERSRRRKKPSGDEDDYGIAKKDDTDEADDSTRVESLMIREDGFEDSREDKQKAPEDLSASSQIENPNDPYGISEDKKKKDSSDQQAAKSQESGDHDYDWFINEMKKDTADIKFDESDNKKADEPKEEKLDTDSTDYGLEPIKPAGLDKKPKAEDTAPDDAEINAGGVDEFISQFKKEMDNLNKNVQRADSEEKGHPRKILSTDKIPITPEKPDDKDNWKDKAPFGQEDIDRISERLVQELAKTIAEKISSSLKKEDIARLIQESLPKAISKAVK